MNTLTKAEAVEAMENGAHVTFEGAGFTFFRKNGLMAAKPFNGGNMRGGRTLFDAAPNTGWTIYKPDQAAFVEQQKQNNLLYGLPHEGMEPETGLNVTKGVAKVVLNSKKEYAVRFPSHYVCMLPNPIHYQGQDERYEQEMAECKANAHLIAEAFNVYNETGLTPRQLVEQRDEALAVIDEAANRLAYMLDLFELPDEAIAMIKGEIDNLNSQLPTNYQSK
jgi:hypothetical protein